MLWLALHLPADASPSAPDVLACWAGRFTPQVCRLADGVRLDIAASLRLFGGLDGLLARVRADLASLPAGIRWAVAATPRAASWLALAGMPVVCRDLAETHAAVRVLPVSVLALPPATMDGLARLGLRCLGDVMALPRASLGRRWGKALLLALEAGLGERHDPQAAFAFPEVFDQCLEFPAPMAATPLLQAAGGRLLAALAGWLVVRQRAVRRLEWHLDHGRGRVTALPLAFSRPVWASARMERVWHEQLAGLRLPAPVLGIRLLVTASEVREGRSATLFDGQAAGGEAFAVLLDRLQARLGEAAVQGVASHADHRPEAATRLVSMAPGGAVTGGGGGGGRHRRPLWLLPVAQRLSERDGRPHGDGPLRLLAGPERIESGWWDAADARRDYFIALDENDRWLWLFRDPDKPGWFLHGLFA